MKKYIKSPMNYMGGKYKLLDSILPLFPKRINNFVDLFTGGLNVGINVDAKSIYANDQITYLIDLYKLFQSTPLDSLFNSIHECIEQFSLNATNTDGYNELRTQYNETGSLIDLFVLTCFSFNHQIRFNSRHQFNTPFGKNRSTYNKSIAQNLEAFCIALQSKNIILSSLDFRDFDFSLLSHSDMVYCDPPYLITNGSYNDGKRGFKDWTDKEELALLQLLDQLNARGILFALSNVFVHKGTTNEALIEWSKKYSVTYLDKSYSNCNYHFKDRTTKTIEVLVTNYATGE